VNTTKKVWIYAILFGILMSVTFLILTLNMGNTNQEGFDPPPSEELQETEPIESSTTNLLGIETGKRAISIPVDEVQGVSGFVRPGSYVDIVVVHPVPAEENIISQVVLENVRVLAVGTTTSVDAETDNQDPYQMVTLEVTSSEGANLALMKEKGTLTLMLRGNEEK
jgi:pilus assembly protein CpaB